MAETDFVLSPDVQRRVLADVLARDVHVVPSLRYRTPEYRRLSDLGAVAKAIRSHRLIGPFLILGDAFTREPPVVTPSRWRGRSYYTIVGRRGGPYLEVFPCFERVSDGQPVVTSGYLAYFPTYYLQDGACEVPAPPEMKSLYRSFVRLIQSRCIRYVMPKVKRTYWIDPAILDRCRRGLTVHVPGLHEFAMASGDAAGNHFGSRG